MKANPWLAGLTALALLALEPSCRGSTGASRVQELLTARSSLIEESAAGTLTWSLLGDGRAEVVVRSPSGEVKRPVTGQLVLKAASDGTQSTAIPLVQDKDTGILRAEKVELSDPITPVEYALVVDGKPWTGTLALPKGGTRQLAESSPSGNSDRRGPHGGTVQAVNGLDYELLVDEDSKTGRIYVLDKQGKPAPQRPDKLKLGIEDEHWSIVEPEWHEDHYVVALGVNRPPRKVTLVVVDGHGPHVALIGWHAGAHVVVGGPHFVTPAYWAHRGWAPHGVVIVDDREHVEVHKIKMKHLPPGQAKKHGHW